MASPLGRDLIYLIMQYLEEESFRDVLHKLEQESGLYFNVKHFEDLIMAGKWAETEKYLSGFTRLDDNRYSMKIYFELRKQTYLEALDRHDRAKAVEILNNDLKIFAAFNEDLFKEMTQLLTLDNFRENEQLSGYRDTRHSRASMVAELKKLIEANPLFRDKLQFPALRASRLRMLVNQSLNWQHSLCPNPRQNPDIKTLFVDHSCRNSNDSIAQMNLNNQLLLGSPPPRVDGSFLAIGPTGNFHHQNQQASQTPLSTWISIPGVMAHQSASASTVNLSPLVNQAMNSKSPMDTAEGALRMRFPGSSDRTLLIANSPSQVYTAPVANWADEFPKSVSRILSQGSAVTTMDFHPIQQTLLLVGTNVGEVSLWEVSSREKLATRSFQVGMAKDQSVLVKKVLWAADGSLFGAAFSKNAIQIYRYHGGNDVRKYLELDAHAGSVNDIAFSNLTKKLCIITCGDDKLIKVWDVAIGTMLYAFEGHSTPVTSVCPHNKENVNYLFSTSVDGKIKAWLYDLGGSRVEYEAPGRSCTKLAYTPDGKRLFSCGTSKEGESHIVEWSESEGAVKRAYQGLHKSSIGTIQFDVTKNRYLAVGDDYLVKVWDIDNVNMLTIIDADGDLPATPRVRFNKDGSLLAVSANDNKIKILATVDGLRLMCAYEKQTFMAPRSAPEAVTQNGNARKAEDTKQRLIEEANMARIWKLVEIADPTQLQSLKVTAPMKVEKISRLLFTNSGNYILALASNGVHLLWKWSRSDQNTSGKATTKVAPLFVQPTTGNLMTNEVNHRSKSSSDDSLSCLALSKNDSYIMSASGGRISLFNMMSAKTMTTFMGPPPSATCLAFHPRDNNVVAVGMDDSTIQVYNVRTDEVKRKLFGVHTKRITGLAFSNNLNTLVSSGADCQIVTWNSDTWEKQKNSFLNIPGVSRIPAVMNSGTHVQFDSDQTRLLVVHQVQISIHDASKLECTRQWAIGESSPPVCQATFSSDSQFVYSIFCDASIRVFTAANLHPLCLITPSAYLPPNLLSSGTVVPRVVAAHPQETNIMAVGLSDGAVVILQPLDSETRWAPVAPSLPAPPPPPPQSPPLLPLITSNSPPPSLSPPPVDNDVPPLPATDAVALVVATTTTTTTTASADPQPMNMG